MRMTKYGLFCEAEARQFVYDDVEHFQNLKRGHTTVGYDSEKQYEKHGNVA